MRVLLFFILFLPLYLFLSASTLNEKSLSPTFLKKEVHLLGWNANEQFLIYEEKTLTTEGETINAVIYNVEKNKVQKEFPLRSPTDKPETVAAQTQNLMSLLEKDGYQEAAQAPFFIGSEKQGFLSPQGDFLLSIKLNLEALPETKDLYEMQVQFQLQDLRSQEEWEIAQMKLESIDGETSLTTDALGTVMVNSIFFSPKEDFLAIIFQERHGNSDLEGLATISLKNTETIRKKIAQMKPPETKPTKPAISPISPISEDEPILKNSPDPTPGAAQDFTTTPGALAQLKSISSPTQGDALFVDWKVGKTLAIPERKMQATIHYFSACQGSQNFGTQVSILTENSPYKILEYRLSSSLSPGELDLKWQNEALGVYFLNEPLRTFAVQPRQLKPASELGRAFALQVGSFSREDLAKKQVDELCQDGLPAYAILYENLYRIRLGRFDSRDKAMQFGQEFLKPVTANFFITPF